MALPAIPLAIAATAQAVSAGVQAYDASKSASYAAKVADYNAKVDIANAQQQAMNAQANITKERVQNEAYLSSQRAAYAASGILSDSGSPLMVQATTAARMETNIQQQWMTAQQQEATGYAAAEQAVAQGKAQAEAYHLQGMADIFKGVGSIALAFAGAPASTGSLASVQAAGDLSGTSAFTPMMSNLITTIN